MSFDFKSFRRLLFQDALDDAIDMLEKRAPSEFAQSVKVISHQLHSYRRSKKWSINPNPQHDIYHERIVQNLYQLGIAASTGEPPPDLPAVNPWMKKILMYTGLLLLFAGGLYYILHKPACPRFDSDREIAIIVDKFGTAGQPFFQKIGLNKQTLEKQIADQLSRNKIDVAIHPVGVTNTDNAKEKCDACKARMVIWGDVEYGDSIRAYLNHYLDHESYDAYIMEYDMPGVEEHYKNVFKLETSQWIGNVQCLVKLFQGLLAREKYKTATGTEKENAIKEAESYFSDLSGCATNPALKIFALHCKAWTENIQDKDTQALATYNEILSLDSSNALALNNSALLYQEQNNFLYAHTRFEKILEQHDIPHVRLANADALTRLDKKDEARKEIENVRGSEDYKLRKDAYESRIKSIPTNAVAPTGSVRDYSPSLSLNLIATQLNTGHREDAIRNLDFLATKLDTASYTREDIQVINELYKAAGATTKAEHFVARADSVGVELRTRPATTSRAVKRFNRVE